MPTIKDIAKAAGVSHGTASNVLNKKGNVSAEKVKRVEIAANQLGYNIHSSAKTLRKGVSNTIAIIIPDSEVLRYRDLYNSISSCIDKYEYTSSLYISNNIPHKEKNIIKKVLSDRVYSIIIISCLSKEDDFYNEINLGNTKICFVERKVNIKTTRSMFYAYDTDKIGQNISNFIIRNGFKKLAYFSNNKIYSFENDIYNSLLSNCKNANVELSEFHCDNTCDIQTAFNILFSPMSFELIITTTEKKAEIIKKIIELTSMKDNVKIMALTSTDILDNNSIIECKLNYKKLGSELGNAIVSNYNAPTVIYDPPQFIFDKNIMFIKNNQEINIACINGPSNDALKYISRIIYSSSGIKSNIISYDYDNLFNLVKNNQIKDIDIFRFDMAWLSWFGEKTFLPLDDIDYDFSTIFNSFIDGISREYSYIGSKKYTLPFDPSMLLLFFRSDLFENSIISRLYYEKYKSVLKAPESFEEYNQIASFFTKNLNNESPTIFGTTITTESPQSLACQFLPIVYNMGGITITDDKLEFNYSLLRKALKLHLESLNFVNTSNAFWEDAVHEFAIGDAAMSITFSNRALSIIDSKISNVLGKYNFVKIPGNKQMIGGGVLGLSKRSKKINLACNFLEEFYSRSNSIVFACLCGASGSKFVYENEDISLIYPWLKLVQENLKNGRRRIGDSTLTNYNFEYNLGKSLRELFQGNYSIDESINNIVNMRFCDTH